MKKKLPSIFNVGKAPYLKTLFTIFALHFAPFAHAQEGQEPCSDLFFSEIIKENTVVNGVNYSNYIIEIFNPTQSPINMVDYSIELTDANAVVTTVPLRGNVAAGTPWAISHSNAENNVRALMKMDTTLLDFNLYTEVKLINKRRNAVIDVFGEPISQSTITFNYLLFMQDPQAYLTQYGLRLRDLDHIGMRRSYFVDKGVAVFNSNDVLGNWAFYTGSDRSNINLHQSVCNRTESSLPVIGYKFFSLTLNENTSLGNNIDDLEFVTSGSNGFQFDLFQKLDSGNAIVGTHICYFSATSANPYGCFYTIGQTLPGCVYARTLNNLFSGQKQIFSRINKPWYPVTNDYSIDPAKKFHKIIINGNSTVGINEQTNADLGVFIYPTVVENTLNVRGSVDCNYSIFSTDGKILDEGQLFNKEEIDTRNLAQGMYIITFNNYSGSKTLKFIKQ